MKIVDVITIDGPAGSGKSTVAKRVAHEMGWTYCDTGAMYRAITLYCFKKNVKMDNPTAIVQLAQTLPLVMDGEKVILDNQDVTTQIRSIEVNEQVSHIAAIPGVRRVMVDLQRVQGEHGQIVMEGRDIGSVVFANARYKFYLDASLQERASRRSLEYKANGIDVELEELKEQIGSRDHKDSYRMDSPLMIPSDGNVIDTTGLSIDEVVNHIISMVQTHEGETLL